MGVRVVNNYRLTKLRQEYHREICNQILGYRREKSDVWLSVADKSSQTSRILAERIARRMGYPLCPSPPGGQSAGTRFVQLTRNFLEAAFNKLQHLRPGKWAFSVSQNRQGITRFYEYEHLAALDEIRKQHPELLTSISPSYLITPDLTIARHPVDDNEINAHEPLVGPAERTAILTPLRSAANPNYLMLHASISCKWSIRSDRAQNTRTEALNLIRDRKGQTPHIVIVTMEPMPTRLASIALGTGDVDCTYHAALYELMDGLNDPNEPELESEREMLETLVNGKRLRDISDLPFDLAI